jgi:hypothetical protein
MITAPTPSQTNVANMVICNMPIRQRIDWLMDHAHRHSAEYQSSEFYQARSLYIAQHPTSIVALNCMDGRVNISVATDTPMGIILPFRNLGGRFSLGLALLRGSAGRTNATYDRTGTTHAGAHYVPLFQGRLPFSTISPTTQDILPALARLYPGMPEQMRQDLLPLVQGNISHC